MIMTPEDLAAVYATLYHEDIEFHIFQRFSLVLQKDPQEVFELIRDNPSDFSSLICPSYVLYRYQDRVYLQLYPLCVEKETQRVFWRIDYIDSPLSDFTAHV
jgi:hypothetical protein